jgi:4-hydroxybenzoate polyprenyltransferase
VSGAEAGARGAGRAGLRALATDAYLAARVSTLGFTLLLPLAGAAFAAGGLAPAAAGPLLLVAVSFHLFAYLLNDVADLRVDRTEPLRADSPLVRGVLSPRLAAWIALAQVPLAFGIALAAGLPRAALGWLATAFAGIAVYDLAGKRCPLPPATDAVQAAGWCALLLFGAASAGEVSGAGLAWPVVYVVLYVLMTNGVHGGLRDLANDRAAGARTTALWLGARADAGGGVAIPRRLAAYALALQAGLCAAAPLAIADGAEGRVAAARALVAAALAASVWLLVRAARRRADRRRLIAAGVGHLVAALAVLPLVALPLLDGFGALVMLAAFAVPAAAMFAYNGSRWGL